MVKSQDSTSWWHWSRVKVERGVKERRWASTDKMLPGFFCLNKSESRGVNDPINTSLMGNFLVFNDETYIVDNVGVKNLQLVRVPLSGFHTNADACVTPPSPQNMW